MVFPSLSLDIFFRSLYDVALPLVQYLPPLEAERSPTPAASYPNVERTPAVVPGSPTPHLHHVPICLLSL